MPKVGIREAKARLSHYIDVARSGGDVIVTDRGTPVVRLVRIAPALDRSAGEVFAELAEAGFLELGRPLRRGPRPLRPRRPISIAGVVRTMRR